MAMARRAMSTAAKAVKEAVSKESPSKDKSGNFNLTTFMETSNIRTLLHLVPFVGAVAYLTADAIDFYGQYSAIQQPARH